MPLWLHATLNIIFILGCVAAPVGVIVALVQQQSRENNARKPPDYSIAFMFGLTLLSAGSLWSGFGDPWISGVVALLSTVMLQNRYEQFVFYIAFAAVALCAIGAAVDLTTPS